MKPVLTGCMGNSTPGGLFLIRLFQRDQASNSGISALFRMHLQAHHLLALPSGRALYER